MTVAKRADPFAGILGVGRGGGQNAGLPDIPLALARRLERLAEFERVIPNSLTGGAPIGEHQRYLLLGYPERTGGRDYRLGVGSVTELPALAWAADRAGVHARWVIDLDAPGSRCLLYIRQHARAYADGWEVAFDVPPGPSRW